MSVSSLNYIGAKKQLLPFLDDVITRTLTQEDVFCDLFAGSGIVSCFFTQKAKYIVSNDIEQYSFVINSAFLKTAYTDKLQVIINDINKNIACINDDTEPNLEQDIVFKSFSPSLQCERMFFTNQNALRIDRTRQYIEKLHQDTIIDINEKNYLIASLIVSVDKLANTTSVYGAYLKKFKASALQPLVIKPVHTFNNLNFTENNVFNMDANVLASDTELMSSVDVVYIDPPYCARQYGANYSPLNYITTYDDAIVLTGKTGLIENYFKSDFAKKTNVKEAFSKLISSLKCKKSIYVSYNSEGLLSKEELSKIFQTKGNVTLYYKLYRKYKSNKEVETAQVFEYLFHIDCLHCLESYSSTGTYNEVLCP
jgi:adenine-specific DNA-methyltransferase